MRTVELRKIKRDDTLTPTIPDIDVDIDNKQPYKANTTFKMGISDKLKRRQIIIER